MHAQEVKGLSGVNVLNRERVHVVNRPLVPSLHLSSMCCSQRGPRCTTTPSGALKMQVGDCEERQDSALRASGTL